MLRRLRIRHLMLGTAAVALLMVLVVNTWVDTSGRWKGIWVYGPCHSLFTVHLDPQMGLTMIAYGDVQHGDVIIAASAGAGHPCCMTNYNCFHPDRWR